MEHRLKNQGELPALVGAKTLEAKLLAVHTITLYIGFSNYLQRKGGIVIYRVRSSFQPSSFETKVVDEAHH